MQEAVLLPVRIPVPSIVLCHPIARIGLYPPLPLTMHHVLCAFPRCIGTQEPVLDEFRQASLGLFSSALREAYV